MIKALKYLEEYDFKELNKYKLGDLTICLVHIITALAILDKRIDGIVKALGEWEKNEKKS